MADKSESLRDCYATITGHFGDAGGFYDPATGHGGTDYRRNTGEAVLAYEGGVVGYVGTSGWGGGLAGMQLDSGEYAGWAHLDPVIVKVGQRVEVGDVIGYVAGWAGNHGTSWTGPHIHTTRSALSSRAAATGVRPLIDPAPGIAKALEGDDMFTDEDRALLRQTAQKAGASYDALFKQSPTSRGEKAGVLSMTNAIYDAQFIQSETSRGTPEGVLGTLAIVLDQQALIMKHLGIEKATE